VLGQPLAFGIIASRGSLQASRNLEKNAPLSLMLRLKKKGERQVKVVIKNLAIFFLFPSKQFLLGNSKFSCCKLFPKNRRNEDKSSKLGADKLVTTQI
jgi:hypothetical protein